MDRRAYSTQWRHGGGVGLFGPYREYGFGGQVLRRFFLLPHEDETVEFGFDLNSTVSRDG